VPGRLVASLAALAAVVPGALAVAGCGSTTPRPPDVSMEAIPGFRFVPASYSAGAGSVKVHLKNSDQMSHSVVVTDARGNRVNTFRLLVAGGHDATGTTTLSAGSYKLVCDIPGHAAQGQIADLVVH
jgi:plastocyanin